MFSVYAVYSGEGKCLHTFAKIGNGNLLDSSIDSLIAVLYIWFANRFASLDAFLKAIPQKILGIQMAYNN